MLLFVYEAAGCYNEAIDLMDKNKKFNEAILVLDRYERKCQVNIIKNNSVLKLLIFYCNLIPLRFLYACVCVYGYVLAVNIKVACNVSSKLVEGYLHAYMQVCMNKLTGFHA